MEEVGWRWKRWGGGGSGGALGGGGGGDKTEYSLPGYQ